jgi:hypothetical protein
VDHPPTAEDYAALGRGKAAGARWASGPLDRSDRSTVEDFARRVAMDPRVNDDKGTFFIIGGSEDAALSEALSDAGMVPVGGDYFLETANPVALGFMLGAVVASGIGPWEQPGEGGAP